MGSTNTIIYNYELGKLKGIINPENTNPNIRARGLTVEIENNSSVNPDIRGLEINVGLGTNSSRVNRKAAIFRGGNVGIGTETPSAVVDIAGGAPATTPRLRSEVTEDPTTIPQIGAIETLNKGVEYTNGIGDRNWLEEKPITKLVTASSYTAIPSDYNKWMVMQNAANIPMTIPANQFPAGHSIKGRQGGLGQVQFVEGSGMTLLYPPSATLFTAEQNAVFEIFFESPTVAVVYGHLEPA